MPVGPEYANLFDGISPEWLQAVRLVLTKARQIGGDKLDGQIVIVVKQGRPKWVRYEDNTAIDEAAA